MGLSLRIISLVVVMMAALFLVGTLLVIAQDSSVTNLTCSARLEVVYTAATEACIGGPDGHICNGGNPPIAEPTGPVSNSLVPLGANVAVDAVDALTTTAFAADGSSGGLAWMRVPEVGISALLLGDVTVRDTSPTGFPAWSAISVQTNPTPGTCVAVPQSGLAVQNSDPTASARLVVNGVSLNLRGTVLVQTAGDETIFVTLDGETQLIANGQTQGMVAGQQIRTTHAPNDLTTAVGPPGIPTPYEAGLARGFPAALLDRPAQLPQPGFVATEGAVNLRASPSIQSSIIRQIPSGQIMSILGRNAAGDWYHVRLPSGETGWMFAELLRGNHGEIAAVYNATPVPPQRYSNPEGRTALVTAPAGVNIRNAPDVQFDAVSMLPAGAEVRLLARSPYSPWVKIDSNGTVGWVAIITLDTQMVIETLPVDYDVPPPPEPTRIPGSWGNAFPDPTCERNCG